MKARVTMRPLIYTGMVAALTLASLSGCNMGRKAYLEQLRSLETGRGKEVSAQTMEELSRGIRQYSAEVEKKVLAAQNLGVYYKMLALKYLDNEMYGLALESLRKAIEIYPENPQLFYYSAVSAARMAKAELSDSRKRSGYFSDAEAYYRRAIFLEPSYINALYGLSILYALELGRPLDAEPLLRTMLDHEKKNTDAMFLLARIYYESGRGEQAVEMYNRIIDAKPGERLQTQAKENLRQVQEEMYGGK